MAKSFKLALIYDEKMALIARRRTLRAALVFAATYEKPCFIRTPEGNLLTLNTKEGY